MKQEAFELLHNMEDTWWYRGRTATVNAALARHKPHGAILDYGAGYGGMYSYLKRYGEVYAFEPDTHASVEARARGYAHVFERSEDALSHQYALIGLFDVVEHIEDDRAFMNSAQKALMSGGYVAITVPAFPFLWSVHDVTHQHFRRHTKATMEKLLGEAGLEVVYMSYWNMILSLPAMAMRLLGRTGESALGLPSWLNAMFFGVVWFESLFMKYVSLPFGTGLVVLARKPLS